MNKAGFELAIELDWMDSNPARGVKALKIPKSKQRPHIPWTDEACALFRAKAIRPARLVFELGIGSVQRPSDLVGFRWGDYDGEALDLTQGKTDTRLWLPCSGLLTRALDEEIEILGGNPHPSAKIVRGERGKPVGYSGMAQMLHRERARLGSWNTTSTRSDTAASWSWHWPDVTMRRSCRILATTRGTW